jgi:hypothetical protein
MSRFEIDWRGDPMLERFFPPGHADAPFVAWLEARELPLRVRRDEIVAIQHREVEELPRHLCADRVQTNIAGTGLAEPVAIKPGQRITAAGLEIGTEDVGRHRCMVDAVRSSCTTLLSVKVFEWT